MTDVHVHLRHSPPYDYTPELLDPIVEAGLSAGLEEIWLLEHTHQFREFEAVYRPVKAYSEYQAEWLTRKMTGSLEDYLRFIESVKGKKYPLRLRFGLEVCYIPKTEDLLAGVLDEYEFDFLTGSVHYIDGWGFDHKAEFWQGVNVDKAYRRYYDIMCDLVESGLFTGLAHPDSIRCFGFTPSFDPTRTYERLAMLLCKYGIYAEQSGGLRLNYNYPELGMNPQLLRTLKADYVTLRTASDAHRPEHAGANIAGLQLLMEQA